VEIRLGNLALVVNWRVILAWPSMRVTGSIVIVLDIFLPSQAWLGPASAKPQSETGSYVRNAACK